MNGDLRNLVKALSEDKKAALLAALTKDTGLTADSIAAAAQNPETTAKLNKLAEKIDPAKLKALVDDPAKLSALLQSPKAKSLLRDMKLG